MRPGMRSGNEASPVQLHESDVGYKQERIRTGD